MVEMAGEELKFLSIDHHGLIAAICKDLKIAEKIKEKLGFDKQRVIKPGAISSCNDFKWTRIY